MEKYSFALLGDSYSGKTTMTHKLTTGDFLQHHLNSAESRISDFILPINRHLVNCRVVEFLAIPKNSAELQDFDGIIYLFDLTMITNYNVEKYIEKITKLYRMIPDIPIAVCGNKFDLITHTQESEDDGDQPATLPIFELRNRIYDTVRILSSLVDCFDTSYKKNYNHTKPFESIILTYLR